MVEYQSMKGNNESNVIIMFHKYQKLRQNQSNLSSVQRFLEKKMFLHRTEVNVGALYEVTSNDI